MDAEQEAEALRALQYAWALELRKSLWYTAGRAAIVAVTILAVFFAIVEGTTLLDRGERWHCARYRAETLAWARARGR